MHSGHPQDFAQGQAQPSSSDPTRQNSSSSQRRQDTTSSYTSMGTTPDFEQLLNEQADGSSNGNPMSAGGMWGMGGFDLQSPIGGSGQSIFQQQQAWQSASNQKSTSSSSHIHGQPSTAGTQTRRLSGTGTLPRDRRRSSDQTDVQSGQPSYVQGEMASRVMKRCAFELTFSLFLRLRHNFINFNSDNSNNSMRIETFSKSRCTSCKLGTRKILAS